MGPAIWRDKKDLSLRDVAKQLGISPNSVRHYEMGIREAPTSVALDYERISDRKVTSEDLHAVRQRWLRAKEAKKAAKKAA